MRTLIQRVSQAQVEVESVVLGKIQTGLLVFIGFLPEDDIKALQWMLHKILGLRIFPDDHKPMNRSVQDAGGGLLLVSQFTLVADLSRGLRPSFGTAAPPEQANALFTEFVSLARQQHQPVANGRFGADMQVHLVNDGPVTFWLESP